MTRRPSPARALLPALLALTLIGGAAPTAAAAAPREERALEQRIDRAQGVASGRAVLSEGHVDMGPRFVDGRWTLMVHDDAARSGEGRSVWRPVERTVLRVGDTALRRAPDDPAYAFLRARPGDGLHVIPQTQDPDVVWLGWNTQDPEAMERIDRGVTMTLLGVEGPGSLIVYLQSGDFGAPQVLWDSAARPRPIWVDVNTHTHANWVFSAPGVYLARVRIEADLVDGSTVTDTRELRFAVGARTSVARAFAASWRGAGGEAAADVGAGAAAGDDDAGAPGAAASAGEAGGGAGAFVAVIAVVALALAVALGSGLARGARAKRRARAEGPDGAGGVRDAAGAAGPGGDVRGSGDPR
ncbi:choice-of-anchor M domain-containing protein [Conexibacter arvalis]|uniref:Surface-anchored protein n=1 Tax=Conexibacter arvalis TaxID=912552 RepID=A0A840IDK9_9ACTN|nr:surface-anchored protein [Conexibacter arvalis]